MRASHPHSRNLPGSSRRCPWCTERRRDAAGRSDAPCTGRWPPRPGSRGIFRPRRARSALRCARKPRPPAAPEESRSLFASGIEPVQSARTPARGRPRSRPTLRLVLSSEPPAPDLVFESGLPTGRSSPVNPAGTMRSGKPYRILSRPSVNSMYVPQGSLMNATEMSRAATFVNGRSSLMPSASSFFVNASRFFTSNPM